MSSLISNPEVQIPEVQIPEIQIPEAQIPEVQIPEIHRVSYGSFYAASPQCSGSKCGITNPHPCQVRTVRRERGQLLVLYMPTCERILIGLLQCEHRGCGEHDDLFIHDSYIVCRAHMMSQIITTMEKRAVTERKNASFLASFLDNPTPDESDDDNRARMNCHTECIEYKSIDYIEKI
jgi:hypothetical protein